MSARTLLQFFHWYYPQGGHLWGEVTDRAQSLKDMGITDVWLPPAYKGATGGYSVGYDSYDLFDLGEFDQKGSVPTKYGDRAALERATAALRDAGVGAFMTWCSITRWARTKRNGSACAAPTRTIAPK